MHARWSRKGGRRRGSTGSNGARGSAATVVLVALGVLLLLVALFAASVLFLSVGRVEAGPEGAGSPGPVALEHAVDLVEAARDAEGRWTATVEVRQLDDWSWETVEVHQAEVKVLDAPDVAAELVSRPPQGPVPERFELAFRTGPVPDVAAARLRFRLRVEGTKHFGLSKATSQASQSVLLEPTER